MSQTVTVTEKEEVAVVKENKHVVAETKSAVNFEQDGLIYEYTSAANPDMSPVPVLIHPPELHKSGLFEFEFLLVGEFLTNH